jgi:hypothetical protein
MFPHSLRFQYIKLRDLNQGKLGDGGQRTAFSGQVADSAKLAANKCRFVLAIRLAEGGRDLAKGGQIPRIPSASSGLKRGEFLDADWFSE